MKKQFKQTDIFQKVPMGSLFTKKVNLKYKSLIYNMGNQDYQEVSCSNFCFVKKLWGTGKDNESIIWLAENRSNPSEKFFIKESKKKTLEDHNRIESLHSQLSLLTSQRSSYIFQPLYAFQDYECLYLVFEYVECYSLEEVLEYHAFTEQQARYVIFALIKIVQYFHQQKYAITELCPSKLLIDAYSGQLKLMELINPLPIDQFYPAHMMTKLNPYSAPEILAMDEVLAESDFYSIGLILYEIIKQSPAIPRQISHDRKAIIENKIQVFKSDLPMGWKSEAADFLLKLLIKKPELRLGKYGSFEVFNHPWLCNCEWSQSFVQPSIHLAELYFQEKILENFQEEQKQQPNPDRINSYSFQGQFQNYQFPKQKPDRKSEDSIQEQC